MTTVRVGDRVGPGEPVVVDAVRATSFAAALDPSGAGLAAAGNDERTGARDAGGGRTAAPATMVVALALGAAGGPVDLLGPLVRSGAAAGVVHGDQQLTVHRPVRVGDRLVFASTVRTVRRLPGALVTVIVTEAIDVTDAGSDGADGEVVADLQATFVLADPSAPAAGPPAPAADPSAPAAGPAA